MAKQFGSSKEPCPVVESPVTIAVLDARKRPVGNIGCILTDALNRVHKGSTGEDGVVNLKGLASGPFALLLKLNPQQKKAFEQPPPQKGIAGLGGALVLVKLKPIEKPPPPPFFNNWLRIEPRCRTQDVGRGLEARTADPLWMLGRQWQFGELQGDDTGSPIEIQVTSQSAPLSIVATAGAEFANGTDVPLETLVERERVGWDHRLRVRAGQQFERLVRSKLGSDAQLVIAQYRIAFPIGADPLVDEKTARFLQLMSGQAVNGELLLAASPEKRGAALPAALSGQAAQVEEVVTALKNWHARLYSVPTEGDVSPAWVGHSLEYQFEARAPVGGQEVVALSAPAYQSGDLDWHTFDAVHLPRSWATPVAQQRSFPPVRVVFRGMANRRFWAFDDQRVDFGSLEVGLHEIAKLALMEFALMYGADWFIVPLPVPLGSVTAVRKVSIFDVFGHQTPKMKSIPRARSSGREALQRWEMFMPLGPAAPGVNGAEVLVVPPVLPFREESAALEEVRFLRDEAANMVWGVEHVVMNGLGEPVGGFEAQLERRARERPPQAVPAAAPAQSGPAMPVYRLATTVPENWIPFLPADADAAFGKGGPGRPSIRLCRAQMLRNEESEKAKPIPSRTHLLDLNPPQALLWLDEHAVPREGAKVVLKRHRARWINGETFVWLGRQVQVGRGEGQSGLRFDVLRDGSKTTQGE